MDTMTVAEAAQTLGLAERTIRHRLQRGQMHGQRIGAWLWLIPIAEVEEWKTKGKQHAGRPKKNRAEDAASSNP